MAANNKDPAFLLYPADFLIGVFELSMEERGQYITLMCLQHQKGHLKESLIRSVNPSEAVMEKFIKDDDGLYFNERLDEETLKRQQYSASRRNNRNSKKEKEDMSNICQTYVPTYDAHMEDRNRNKDRDVNKEAIKDDIQDIRFAEFWQAYPRKAAKAAARKSWMKIKPTKELHEQIIDKVSAYKQSEEWKKENGSFIPHPATWLNQGRWEDEIYKQPSSNPFKDYYLKEVDREQNRSGLPNGDHQDILPRILPPDE